jgi:hypothetical protein
MEEMKCSHQSRRSPAEEHEELKLPKIFGWQRFKGFAGKDMVKLSMNYTKL